MKTFKNKNFTKRDYECSNVVVCQSEKAPNANWIEVDVKVISEMNLQSLGSETANGIDTKYYGYL